MDIKMTGYNDTDTLNKSRIDEELFAEEVDPYLWSWQREIFRYLYIFAEITVIIVCLLALISDIYLIVVIRKFKNLQNRINNFILQYAIFNILYLILANLLIIIIRLCSGIPFWFEGYCFVSNLDHLLLTLGFYVLTFMTIDWYISNFHSNIYERYPKVFKYGAYFLYLFALPKWIATSVVCFINEDDVEKSRMHLELISFAFCVSIIVCISVLMRRNTLTSDIQKTEYALIIPRTVILISLFFFIIREVILLSPNNPSGILMSFVYLLLSISKISFFAAPIIVLYQATKLNKNFKSAYLKSCKKRWVKSYTDENLDADSIPENLPNNVSYDRSGEVINF